VPYGRSLRPRSERSPRARAARRSARDEASRHPSGRAPIAEMRQIPPSPSPRLETGSNALDGVRLTLNAHASPQPKSTAPAFRTAPTPTCGRPSERAQQLFRVLYVAVLAPQQRVNRQLITFGGQPCFRTRSSYSCSVATRAHRATVAASRWRQSARRPFVRNRVETPAPITRRASGRRRKTFDLKSSTRQPSRT